MDINAQKRQARICRNQKQIYPQNVLKRRFSHLHLEKSQVIAKQKQFLNKRKRVDMLSLQIIWLSLSFFLIINKSYFLQQHQFNQQTSINKQEMIVLKKENDLYKQVKTCIYYKVKKQKMKTQTVRHSKTINKKSLTEYERSIRQQSSFIQSQQLYTPEHTNLQYGDMLCYTKQSLKTSNQLSCANKMCQHYSLIYTYNQEQTRTISIQEITAQTLCEHCQQQFKKDSYCIYCKQIYFDSTDDGKEWIMCEECSRWVHSQCADFNTKQNPNAVFKCIKCKKISNQNISRRNVPRTLANKIQKKKNSQFLTSIGFQWELNVNQIAEDMQNLQQYLTTS